MIEWKTTYPVTVLALSGDFGMPEFFSLGKILESFCQTKQAQVVLDFSQVTHVHYRGVKTLKNTLEKLKKAQGELKCVGLNNYVKNILDFSGMAADLKPHVALNDAILSFERPSYGEHHWH